MSEEQGGEKKERELLDPGVYKARAVGAELTEKDGKPVVVVVFELKVGETIVGKRYWRGFFTEKTELRTLQSLKYAGLQGSDISDLSTLGSCECDVVIEHEEYEGKMFDRIQWVNSSGIGDIKNVMDANRKKLFASQMKAKLAAVQAGTAKKNAAADTRPEPPPIGEDLPF